MHFVAEKVIDGFATTRPESAIRFTRSARCVGGRRISVQRHVSRFGVRRRIVVVPSNANINHFPPFRGWLELSEQTL
jgi:hypothetical protein